MSQYEMNVHDYFRIIRKRKWVIILTTLAVYIAAIVYTKMQTKLYESIAYVIIAQRSVSNDAIFGTSGMGTYYNSKKSIENAQDIIKSKSVMLRVINQLNLMEKNSNIADIDSIIGKLSGRISVEPDPNSGRINIKITSSEPEKSTKIINAMAEAYRIESEKQARYSEQVLVEYLKEQLEIAKERLDQSYGDLLNFRQQYSLELTSGSNLNPAMLETMTNQLEETAKKRIDFEKQIELLQQKRNGKDIDITKLTALMNDNELKNIFSERDAIKKELDDLNQKFMPQHPKIFLANDKLARLNEKFEVLLDNKINTIITDMEQTLNDIYNTENKLKRDIELSRIRIANLPRVGLEEKKLERAYVVSDELYTMLKKKLEETRMRAASEVGDVREIQEATVPTKPIYPNERQSALAGLVIGLILGFAFAFIVESMDTSIGTIEDVEKYVQKTVLGVIPHIKIDSEKVRKLRKRIESAGEVFNERQARLVSICDPKSPVTEAYRTLRTNLQFALPNKTGCNTLLLSSATPQEGKSTSLTNLAVIWAQAGKKTLIMSCNLRHPSVYKIFGAKKKPGITDILAGTITWREAIQDPGIDNLRILAAGPYPPNPSEILQSQEFDDLIKELKQEFEIILFDSPPILPVTDAAIIASKVDAVVLVYFVGKAAREALMRAKIQLENVNANIIGVVLNDIKAEGKLAYTYYYHYQYKYYGVRDASEV